MNLIIGLLIIAAPALFLIYWGKSGFDWGSTEDRKEDKK
ncbi:hypothetical protein J2Z58_002392 [Halobacillus andaensis]|nr:hypothetical protein [Halobacillus andaensis]